MFDGRRWGDGDDGAGTRERVRLSLVVGCVTPSVADRAYSETSD